jgi:DNA-binding MarR family transcriptional regulator
MIEYKDLLVLSYFYQKKEMYSFTEIQDILGFSRNQLSNRLDQLLENGYLLFVNELLSVSSKGKEIIYEKNFEAFPFFTQGGFENDQSAIESSLGIYDVYVPKDFDKKV